MDRLIYVAMNGAKHTMHQQAQVAHNLANAATTGYKAEANAFRALPVVGDGAQTRTFVVDATAGADLSAGKDASILPRKVVVPGSCHPGRDCEVTWRQRIDQAIGDV